MRRSGLAQHAATRAARKAFLHDQLEPVETVIAQSDRAIVTDRRIIQAHRLQIEPRRGEWVCDATPFDAVTLWALGSLHDGRPLLRIEHQPLSRIEHVPEHRFLMFAWGNAEASVIHRSTSLAFGRRDDPLLLAIVDRLTQIGIVRGPSFEVRPPGTRAERMGTSRAYTRSRGWRLDRLARSISPSAGRSIRARWRRR